MGIETDLARLARWDDPPPMRSDWRVTPDPIRRDSYNNKHNVNGVLRKYVLHIEYMTILRWHYKHGKTRQFQENSADVWASTSIHLFPFCCIFTMTQKR